MFVLCLVSSFKSGSVRVCSDLCRAVVKGRGDMCLYTRPQCGRVMEPYFFEKELVCGTHAWALLRVRGSSMA